MAKKKGKAKRSFRTFTDKDRAKIRKYMQGCDLLMVARLWDYFRDWPTEEDCLRLHHADGMDERADVLCSMLEAVRKEFPEFFGQNG